jgi:hypothetical protein
MTPEFWIQLVIGAGSAFAVYGAIRADLARALAKAEAAEASATRAHVRIDNFSTFKGAQ